MSIVNIPLCTTALGNTGVPSCYFVPKKIKGIFIVDRSFKIEAANLATEALFKAALQAASLATGKGRIYPVANFEAITDNSEELQKETTGYGFQKIAREGLYDFTFEYSEGGMCLHKQLRKFNNSSSLAVMMIDDENKLFGQIIDGDLYGFTAGNFFAHKVKMNDGSASAKFMINFQLTDPSELNDRFGIIPCSFDVTGSIKGILDITVSQSSVVAGTAKVLLTQVLGGSNLYIDFADLFADTDAWVVKNASTGATVTITSVAKNAAISGWDISFTGTGGFTIQTASAAALAALGIGGSPDSGYESDVLSVTMPA